MNHLLRTSERLRARALLRTVTCALGLAAAVSGPAVAADTDIADYPMSVANMAKSNVMFVLDNSGGMDVDTLLPTFNSMYYESNIPKTQQTTTTLFGFFYFQPNKQVNGANRAGSFYLGFTGNADANAWKARNAKSNPQYYDPTLTYKPWLGVDSSGATFANANPASAYLDPYIGASGGVNNTFNLQQWYAIPNAATYLSNATGPASAIPSYTTPGTGIQYCDTTAHTGAATYPSSGTITYT